MSIDKFAECRGILFDYGGTLDSDGQRWPDRFYALYKETAIDFPHEEIKRAFYYAEDCCYADPKVTALGLRALVGAHVHLQFESLGVKDRRRERALADKFCATSEKFMLGAARLMKRAKPRYRLGIVSNFYGNLTTLLKEAGLLEYLEVIVDSNRVGAQKPDPKIFHLALEQLGLLAHQVIFVGDSYERDMVPSKELGMKTVWLKGPNAGTAEAAQIDACISSLTELEALIL
jgi:HAD superfamily hydrolase (TIGR01549 family)